MAEAQRHLAQQLVADAAAQRAVDQLEAVQVQVQHAGRAFVALDRGQALVDQARKQRAVRQAGQLLVVGQVVQAFLGQLAFGDVRQVGDQADRVVFDVAERRQRQAGPEHLARLLAAPDFHHASALLGKGVREVRAFVALFVDI
jgi:hypothetical protein